MFSREFCEIFKSTVFIEHLRATASVEVRVLNSQSRALGSKPLADSKVDPVFYPSPLFFKVACRVQIWKKNVLSK